MEIAHPLVIVFVSMRSLALIVELAPLREHFPIAMVNFIANNDH